MEKQKQGFAIVALVLGIIGLVFSFIPIVNNLAFIIGVIGVVFGIVALITKNKKGLSIAGIITSILAIVITLVMQAAFASAFNTAVDEASDELETTLDDASGENTEALLSTAVDVQLGTFTATQDEYGFVTSSLPVTVTNLTDEAASFSITIEAVNADGSRLNTDYVYCDSLGASQSMSQEVFTYISSDELEAYQSATFQVLEVSKY